jgi:hypothetical protein
MGIGKICFIFLMYMDLFKKKIVCKLRCHKSHIWKKCHIVKKSFRKVIRICFLFYCKLPSNMQRFFLKVILLLKYLKKMPHSRKVIRICFLFYLKLPSNMRQSFLNVILLLVVTDCGFYLQWKPVLAGYWVQTRLSTWLLITYQFIIDSLITV